MKEVSIYANGRRFNRITHVFSEIPESARNNVVAQVTKAALYDEVEKINGEYMIVQRYRNVDAADEIVPIPSPSLFKKYFFNL